MDREAFIMKLYEIPAALRALEDKIEEAEGLLTPELEAELDGLTEEFDRKAEYIAMLIREAKLEAEKWRAEEDRVAARRRSLERRAEGLTRYVHEAMVAMGRDKIAGDLLTVAIQRNGSASVGFEGDPMSLPEEFRRVQVSINGRALAEAYKAGQALPEGVEINHGTHVRIR
jgi:hypothetical protein